TRPNNAPHHDRDFPVVFLWAASVVACDPRAEVRRAAQSVRVLIACRAHRVERRDPRGKIRGRKLTVTVSIGQAFAFHSKRGAPAVRELPRDVAGNAPAEP